MDKTSFETFEYLPENNVETSEQFFVVQDDGTFLINRQKEELGGVQSCTVYDVTSQQFYVDIDNSTELISVPENFILPVPEAGNNLYGNSYLLQTMPNEQAVSNETNTNQVEEITDQLTTDSKEENEAGMVIQEGTSCTEITLTDEQYNTLEQKGWVLLEADKKIFVLDTMGLHDITNNHELIKQLQSDMQSSDIDAELRHIKNDDDIIPLTFEDDATNESNSQQESMGLVIDDNYVDDENSVTEPHSVLKVQNVNEPAISLEDINKRPSIDTNEIEVGSSSNHSKTQKDGYIIRIKTKLSTKEIPDRIVLGKTANGKNLVARVVKPDTAYKTKSTTPPAELMRTTPATEKVAKNIILDKTNLMNKQFESLVKRSLHSDVKFDPVLLADVQDCLAQLLQMPSYRPYVAGCNIVVTKVVRSFVKNIRSDTVSPNIVTGRVETHDGRLQFIHVPDLLHQLLFKVESEIPKLSNDKKDGASSNQEELVHVHITESKRVDGTESIAITLGKRPLPYKLASIMKKRQANRLYACSSCAKVYQTQKELLDHHEIQCIDSDDTLTIDTERTPKTFEEIIQTGVKINPYYILKTSTGTLYACLQCPLKFNKICNYQRHAKTHSSSHRTSPTNSSKPHKKENPEDETDDQKNKIYKCKMCSSTYCHPSTLSKHIVTAHIKVNNAKYNS